MDDMRKIDAEERELLVDITRFLVRAGQHLLTRQTTEGLIEGFQLSETRLDDGQATLPLKPAADTPAMLRDAGVQVIAGNFVCAKCDRLLPEGQRSTEVVPDGDDELPVCLACEGKTVEPFQPIVEPRCGACWAVLTEEDKEEGTGEWKTRVHTFPQFLHREKKQVTVTELKRVCAKCAENPEAEAIPPTVHAPTDVS